MVGFQQGPGVFVCGSKDSHLILEALPGGWGNNTIWQLKKTKQTKKGSEPNE